MRPQLGLLSLIGGAVARLQVGLVVRRQVLGLGPDELGWFRICVGFELCPVGPQQHRSRYRHGDTQ